jgi:hypothetical protein
MTTATGRRLTKLEGALLPREAVLAWLVLVEAQQFPSLVDHARSIAELPVEAAPLSVIGERIEAATPASMKGQPRDAIWEAIRRSVGDGAFLFCLVFQINGQALEFAKVEGLRAAAVFFWMGTLLGGPRTEDLPAAQAMTHVRELADAWALWRTVVDRLSLEVRIEHEARATLERQFFGGHGVLLADAAEAWAGHVDIVERLMGLAEVMPWTGRAKDPRRSRTGMDAGASLKGRVADRVVRLADDARVRAYEIMGDRPRAVAIMERRLLGDWISATDGRIAERA